MNINFNEKIFDSLITIHKQAKTEEDKVKFWQAVKLIGGEASEILRLYEEHTLKKYGNN